MAKIIKPKEILLPVSLLKEILHYEYETGLFYWLVARDIGFRKGAIPAGTIAGFVSKVSGYSQIKINSVSYKAHHLAWLYAYGKFPSGVIDHINRDKTDNRLENLRDVTVGDNNKNKPKQSNNVSGYNGVYYKIKKVGIKTYHYAVAQWTDLNGKQLDKSFNTEKHGYEDATLLAVSFREARIAELNEKGAGYTENHGK